MLAMLSCSVAWFLGGLIPIIGGPVITIIAVCPLVWNDKE